MVPLTLIRISKSHTDEVQSILEAAPLYSLYVSGSPAQPGDAESLFDSFPPNVSPENKHVLLIQSTDGPIGVIDLIAGYPQSSVAYIGLFLLKEGQQGRGRGATAYRLLENYIRAELKMKKVRLAVVESNPVLPFWEKMGFKKTGETKPYSNKSVQSVSTLMEKKFRS